MRGHAGEATHVAVLATLAARASAGARRRGGLPGRRRVGPRRVAPDPPAAAVPTGRATLIRARAFDDEDEAGHWLDRVDAEAEVAAALAVLNRMLHLHRTATADPAVHEVARGHALVARVGIGAGDQVADGRFARAVELPPPPRPRRPSAQLRPEERLAALLAGRDAPLASEELALRARADLAAGRRREAALQLRVALAAALGELAPWAPRGDLAARLDELRALRPAVDAAAEAALQGGLDDAMHADVERVLGRLEAALRARTVLAFD